MSNKITIVLEKAREKVLKWLDENIEVQEQKSSRPISEADQFSLTIAREIEQVMLKEAFTPYGEPTYIPRDYIVFLNKEDDAAWQGQKREGLKRGLFNALSERAGELVGQQQFQTPNIAIELRVDGALDPGKFSVKPIWDPNDEKTVSISKSKQPKSPPTDLPLDEDTELKTLVLRFTLRIEKRDTTGQVSATEERPIYSLTVTIGRSKNSDLFLPDDREIGRRQATLTMNEDHSYTLDCHGQNPIRLADGSDLSTGKSVTIKAGDAFRLASYYITILSNSSVKEDTGDSSLA